MIGKIRGWFNRLGGMETSLKSELESLKMLVALTLVRGEPKSLREAEFSVFSQWGDDGIIQYLIRQLGMKDDFFIEFGVEDYRESNTRFLLMNNNWSGLVLDSSAEHIASIRKSPDFWKHDLEAREAFLTAENVNSILGELVQGEIGLLSIDIDGNDYWIWKAIRVISPVIVIVEYNSVMGVERAVSIPYDPSFNRMEAHYSGLYAGASLLALCDLGEEKGYDFIGCNRAGNNAYFIRKDRCLPGWKLAPEEGFVSSKFREARYREGGLSYIRGEARLKLLAGCHVVNTRTGVQELL